MFEKRDSWARKNIKQSFPLPNGCNKLLNSKDKSFDVKLYPKYSNPDCMKPLKRLSIPENLTLLSIYTADYFHYLLNNISR